MIDTERMRDALGRVVRVGDTVMALRNSSKVGAVFDFNGYVAEIQKTQTPGRLQALVQPFGGGEAKWLGGRLVELPMPAEPFLEGVLGEWVEQ